MEDKELVALRKGAYYFTVLLLLSVVLCLPSFAEAQQKYRTEEVSGQVVDSINGKPIEGVVLLAIWGIGATEKALEGKDTTNISLADLTKTLCVQEAVTDEKGRYLIPSKGPFVIPEHWLVSESNPTVLGLKPGYHLLWMDKRKPVPSAQGPYQPVVGDKIIKLQTHRDPEDILAGLQEYNQMVPIDHIVEGLENWVEEILMAKMYLYRLDAKNYENAKEFLKAFDRERARYRNFINTIFDLRPELEQYVSQQIRKR
jgi:hypothetical protein